MNIVCPQCLATNRVPEQRLNDAPVCGKCKQALLPAAPISASDDSFARHIERSDLPVVVDFWASWCGPCVQFAPTYEATARAMHTRARFLKVDTEACQQTAARFGIRSIPTLMVFKQGREVDRVAGALPGAQFQQWLSQHL
ncbi:thioredoxin TrxC [Aestuariibacter halophilus]|uniref:Thioredoxin n=1 Tax=Fluctibacter halophilus TaxID=226011 RepID=A0ABS8G3C7_9ALTE|nr:thioredoxin TrxC [Aestuariibacter halophilus]MCC2614636.1 thioredoxin TrxC [Aestuariibacter halophilus]